MQNQLPHQVTQYLEPSTQQWVRTRMPQLLLLALVWVFALLVPFKVHEYRTDFKKYYQLKTTQQKLQIDYSKLLLEQQTFGSTPTIGARAAEVLGMQPPAPHKIQTLSIAPAQDGSAASVADATTVSP